MAPTRLGAQHSALLVARPRLIRQVDIYHRHLAFITGPAGSGKSALVEQLRDSWPDTAGCMALDHGDNDFSRFWLYVLAALRSAHYPSEVGPHALQPDEVEFDSFEGAAFSFLDGTLANLSRHKRRVLLTIDGFEVITNETIRASVDYFVDNLPDTVHVVIAGRTEPELLLHKARSTDDVSFVSGDDLRLTPTETRPFLDHYGAARLSNDDVRLAEDLTEGWVTGVKFAAQLIASGAVFDNASRELAGLSNAYSEYFKREVFARLGPRVRRFLLRTSILPEFCAQLCNAVCGVGSSGVLIDELERRNLFITRLDDEGIWYRFHGLFSAFLRRELQHHDPDSVPTLQSAAASWGERNGKLSAAITHSLRAGELDRAFSLMSGNIQRLCDETDRQTLDVWAEELPEAAIVHGSGRMTDYGSILAITGHGDRAASWIMRAAQTGPETTNLRNRIRQASSLCELMRGNAEGAIQSLEQFDDDAGEPPETDARVLATLVQAYAWARRFEEAESMSLSGASGALEANVHDVVLPGARALAAFDDGHLVKAKDLAEAALAAAAHSGISRGMCTVTARLALSGVLLERNCPKEAEEILKPVWSIVGPVSSTALAFLSYTMRAQIQAARGHLGELRDVLARARHPSAPLQGELRDRFIRMDARLLLSTGDVDLALARLGPLRSNEPTELHLALAEVITGRSLVARRRLDGIDETRLSLRERIQCELIRARSCPAGSEEALAAFRRAIALAEPEGYIRTVLDEGPAICKLLAREAMRSGSSYLRVLNTDQVVVRGIPLPAEDPLTQRELAVLRYLSTSLANQEIAEELYISVNTLKTHVKSIYRKLNAGSRSEATRKAVALGVI